MYNYIPYKPNYSAWVYLFRGYKRLQKHRYKEFRAFGAIMRYFYKCCGIIIV